MPQKKNSLVSGMRWDKYSREYIVELIKKNNFKTVVEIGTAAGFTASYILKNIKDKDFKLYCVDPYLSYKDYENDGTSKIVKKCREQAYKDVFLDSRAIHLEEFSEKAAKRFGMKSIDMVFIDGNHNYKYVMQDLKLWHPVVKKKGIVSGHDFGGGWHGVKKAVREFYKNRLSEIKTGQDRFWWIIK